MRGQPGKFMKKNQLGANLRTVGGTGRSVPFAVWAAKCETESAWWAIFNGGMGRSNRCATCRQRGLGIIFCRAFKEGAHYKFEFVRGTGATRCSRGDPFAFLISTAIHQLANLQSPALQNGATLHGWKERRAKDWPKRPLSNLRSHLGSGYVRPRPGEETGT